MNSDRTEIVFIAVTPVSLDPTQKPIANAHKIKVNVAQIVRIEEPEPIYAKLAKALVCMADGEKRHIVEDLVRLNLVQDPPAVDKTLLS